MEPYCKVLPICYTPIQTSREFSVVRSVVLNVIGSKESSVRESDVSLADYGTRFIIPGV